MAVTVTDSQGRKAVTTAVPLQVYAAGEKLSDREIEELQRLIDEMRG